MTLLTRGERPSPKEDKATEPPADDVAVVDDATDAQEPDDADKAWEHDEDDVDSTTTYVHSPQLAARLVAYVVLFGLLALAARTLERTLDGLNLDLIDAVAALPSSLAPAIEGYVITAAVSIIGVALVTTIAKQLLRFTLVVAAAAVTAFVLEHLGFHLFVDDRNTTPNAGIILSVTAAAVAVMIVMSDEMRPNALRLCRLALLPAAIISVAWTRVSASAELLAITGGALVGSGIGLLGGTPSRAPSGKAVERALERAGLSTESVVPSDADARASVPWIVRTATGSRVFVKTQTSEQRSADLLYRVWRALRLRKPGDERPESSLRRAVEHEAFVATRAAAVGVRTPRLVALGRIGTDGVFAGYQAIEGRTFDEVGSDLTPANLRSAWSMMQAMHRSGIAHRDLRAANLLLDDEDEVWIVDFGVAELAASDHQMRLDMVELLASTAAVVGIEEAVGPAFEVLGPNVLAEALPLLQRAALCAATRKAISKSELDTLRRTVIDKAHVPEPEKPHLERIRPKTVLTIVALGIALWVLLPQVAKSGDLWGRVTQAQLGWVGVALLASFVTYVATAVSLMGACPTDVRFLPTLTAQVACSFTNRITPGNVGGMALNVRFLTSEGASTGTAVASVGLSSLAGGIAHGVLIVFAVAWAGSAGFGGLSLPEPKTIAITGGIVVAVVALGLAIPHTRRFLKGRARSQVRQSMAEMAELAHQPVKLVMLFGGSAMVTIANTMALYAGVRAFGVAPALATVAVVYLAGSAVGSAAPTPSGLGALEAAVVAGLVATAVPESAAVAGVLLFRLATFWIPILPGWLCFLGLQRADKI
jgi:undecaprenyl-diphosphatase